MIDCHTDVILCMSFNTDGSLLTTTCKDKKLRVIEPRSGRVLQVEPYVLLRGRTCWSLWRKRAVLGPCTLISPMPLDQPIGSGPFSALFSATMVTSPPKRILLLLAMDLQFLSPWGLPSPIMGPREGTLDSLPSHMHRMCLWQKAHDSRSTDSSMRGGWWEVTPRDSD